MSPNLFDRLAELDVPPPPVQFDQQLHQRVNRSLVVGQLVDLLVGAFPWAAGHFAKALLGAILFTVTGRYETDTKQQRRR